MGGNGTYDVVAGGLGGGDEGESLEQRLARMAAE
jgi:hypothetical protein